MSRITAQPDLVDRISAFGAYLAHVIRGGKPAPEKRWSAAYVSNLVCWSAVAIILVLNFVTSNWRIGLNTQEIRCLEGTVFLVRNRAPAEVERGQLIAYKSLGLEPLLKNGTTVAKLVAAVPGDRVTVNAHGISINDKFWGPLNEKVMAKTGKSAGSVSTSYTVKSGELLVLGDLPRSYDGRYWGTIKSSQLIGPAWRLW